MRTFDQLAQGRDNNFNLLRMIAASAVLVSHAYPLALGGSAMEPLAEVAPTNLGRLAVAVFFAVSGFFITKSFDRRQSLIRFGTDRVLRIMPGLFVVLILSVAVLGPLFTVLPSGSYWSAWETWTYLPRNLSLYRLQWALPGVFAANPLGAVNGSLWTLSVEVDCYVMVVVVGLSSLLSTYRFAVFLVGYGGCYAALRLWSTDAHVAVLCELSFPFVIGMASYVYRDRVPISFTILLSGVALALLARGTPVYHELFVVTLSYAAFCFGGLQWRWLRRYNLLGDYSYGMYIYAFPIEQAVVALLPHPSPIATMAVAFAVTLVLAVLSWRLVEQPMLAQRHRVGRALDDRLRRLRG